MAEHCVGLILNWYTKLMFTHNPLTPIEMLREERHGRRVYVTPSGKAYPSVTSVLGFEPKPEIEAWKARVGEEEAKAIMNRAAGRGTLIHSYAEDYLNNKVPNVSMFDIDMWKSLRPILDRIDNIQLLEGRLYSDKLEIAGACDCVADYIKVLSLVDFKSSGRLKSEAEILSYFLQATCYACMVYERYDLKIKQIVIIIAVDNESPQVFVKNIADYIEPLLDLIKRYKLHVRGT